MFVTFIDTAYQKLESCRARRPRSARLYSQVVRRERENLSDLREARQHEARDKARRATAATGCLPVASRLAQDAYLSQPFVNVHGIAWAVLLMPIFS